MTHPTDADVEAMARALCRADNESFIVAGDIAKNKVPALIDREWQNWERMARAALAALPPEMRAAGEMKRALAAIEAEIGPHGIKVGSIDRMRAALDQARAALALASSPGQQSTKDGEEDGQADAASR